MFMITWIFGLHNYIGDALSLHCEPSNLKDPHSVAVMSSDNEVVDHIPVSAECILLFLQRHDHNSYCEISGERVNWA